MDCSSKECQENKSEHTSRKIISIGILAVTLVVLALVSLNGATQILQNGSLHRDLQSIEDLKLVWLVGYPAAGANPFVELLHRITKRSTATNIGFFMMDEDGKEYRPNHDSIPVREDQPSPSFTTYLDSPDKYVLTQTQGYGACYNCHPDKYLGPHSYARYMNTNVHANRIADGKLQAFSYNMELVEKLLLLVRNPLDMAVIRLWKKREIERENSEFLLKYPYSYEGFQKYCHDMDNSPLFADEKEWYENFNIWEEAEDVPCRSEFVKIFIFYNRARQLGMKFNLEMKMIRYEETNNYHSPSVINEALNYVGLELQTNLPTAGADTYVPFEEYFTRSQYEAIKKLANKMLVPYFKSEFEYYWTDYFYSFHNE